ncbi:PilZ domain-containing protein [Desulfuromusa kysingii]|uniref:PilZ domain-containing protein n=1 Tax=Desulfuromusa kysingii TaxID=37625 RepID=A0A1H3VPT3_9BACT|nr:PilZ domain-containing protein [Desulfuromusa kysingii]SDZ76122.1 PilZ domain-containing protein [Desulfuromusa kysingii]
MSVLRQLKDYRVVKVSLPLLDGNKIALDAVAKTTTSPHFEVTFLPDQLNPELLNHEEFCFVGFDVAGENKSIKAKINTVVEKAKLLLEMVESFAYIQKRGYFRVDADLSVSYWIINEEHPSAKSVQTPVNISGGGLRLPVSEKIKTGTQLGLEIVIDAPQSTVVECVGEVVSNYDDDKGNRQVALTFVDIEDDDRDAIIAYCLAEQRKQLRLRVKLIGDAII